MPARDHEGDVRCVPRKIQLNVHESEPALILAFNSHWRYDVYASLSSRQCVNAWHPETRRRTRVLAYIRTHMPSSTA